jgi:hypothetical protein
MSLDEKFIPVRTGFYDLVGTFFEKIAGLLGYPKNPGMPAIYDMPNDVYANAQFFHSLPKHRTYWPPIQRPETWFEMLVGPAPKIDAVPRYIYESKGEGFYNFYIENYKNIYFLPDWVSEFIQVRLNIFLDISLLETIREVLFIGLIIYSQMVVLRIAVSWLLFINPYTFPWCYLAAAVDWTEDALQGIIPSILGVNVTGSIFLGALGVVADSLNHLVFTMPFLPSEAEESKLLINQEMKDVLVFHYLPLLWYKHPIPDSIREFWYYQRPDILEYMETAYKDVDIQFLPNSVIQELNQKADLIKLSQPNNINEYLSTEILSKESLFQSNEFINYINDNFHTFALNHLSNLF